MTARDCPRFGEFRTPNPLTARDFVPIFREHLGRRYYYLVVQLCLTSVMAPVVFVLRGLQSGPVCYTHQPMGQRSDSTEAPVHWADQIAQRIIAQRGPLSGQKPHFTCASGITPSGTIHIGNFREIISVDLIVRALRDTDQTVRFIYSWDDFDTFRKVPVNMPKQEMLKGHLRRPIVDVPDPYEETESYARHNEMELEATMPRVGVAPEYLYQAARYRAGKYAEGMRTALEHRDTIRAILNEHRTSRLPEGWWPISIFSSFTNKDTTTILEWDGEWGLRYRCEETGNEETIDLRATTLAKLFWRIDWPMRWAFEGVDFEPGGKEHHSAGGSFDTSRVIAEQVYEIEPPVTFKYDFISIKGRGGKISSSSGVLLSVDDVLEVYQPEVLRYLFAGTRPNAEFQISFDLDVIKIYEDYDRCERIYYGLEEVGEKRRVKDRRTYELSQLPSVAAGLPAAQPPLQLPFRTLCNFLMITAGDIDAALARFPEFDPKAHADQLPRLKTRAECAWRWISSYAPEDFRFELKSGEEEPITLTDAERNAVGTLTEEVAERLDAHDEISLAERIYAIADETGVEKKRFFAVMYLALIGKERGPRLAGFLLTIGRERVLQILNNYARGEGA
jgi:lysyl-tRNA synthetase class 1